VSRIFDDSKALYKATVKKKIFSRLKSSLLPPHPMTHRPLLLGFLTVHPDVWLNFREGERRSRKTETLLLSHEKRAGF